MELEGLLAFDWALVITDDLRLVADEPGLFEDLAGRLVVLIDHYAEHRVTPRGFATAPAPVLKVARLAVSDPSLAPLLQDEGIDLNQVLILPRGLDHELFEHPPQRAFPWRKEGGVLYVLNAVGDGLLDEPERFLALARAAWARWEREVQFLWPVRSIRLPYGSLWKENVLYVRWLAHQQMPALYEIADIVLSPGGLCPQTITEALAMGKPVLTENAGWLQLLKGEALRDFREASLRRGGLSVGDFIRSYGREMVVPLVEGEAGHWRLRARPLGAGLAIDRSLILLRSQPWALGAGGMNMDALEALDRFRGEAGERARQELAEAARGWAREWPTWEEVAKLLLASTGSAIDQRGGK
jgi:hypothetical protein